MAADPILSPMQPERPRQMKTVNVKVDVRHHAIPPMLRHLSRFMLTIVAFTAPACYYFIDEGWAHWAALVAMVAWTIASVDAIMDHIISQQPSTRQEVIEEITRAQKTHLTIR